MTRINVVPVECLINKHLFTEYKEITKTIRGAQKRLDQGCDFSDIPPSFQHGEGHEKFFFDKVLWLWLRHGHLYIECCRRGFDMDFQMYYANSSDFLMKLKDTHLWNMWSPTPEDMYLNMARLVERSGYLLTEEGKANEII